MENRQKYVDAVKKLLIKESSSPSVELVRFLAARLCHLNLTEKMIDELASITREAFQQFIDDQIKSKSSLSKGVEKHQRQSEHVVSDEEFENFFVVNVA